MKRKLSISQGIGRRSHDRQTRHTQKKTRATERQTHIHREGGTSTSLLPLARSHLVKFPELFRIVALVGHQAFSTVYIQVIDIFSGHLVMENLLTGTHRYNSCSSPKSRFSLPRLVKANFLLWSPMETVHRQVLLREITLESLSDRSSMEM